MIREERNKLLGKCENDSHFQQITEKVLRTLQKKEKRLCKAYKPRDVNISNIIVLCNVLFMSMSTCNCTGINTSPSMELVDI